MGGEKKFEQKQVFIFDKKKYLVANVDRQPFGK